MKRQVTMAEKGRGFSLPELLLVVAIIGLGVAASIPLIAEQVRSARVRAVSDEFNMSLRAVRMIAVSTRVNASMEILDNGYRYDDIYGRARSFSLPVGVRIASSTSPSIIFRPNGSVLGGGETIVFESLRGDEVLETWTFAVNMIGVTAVTHTQMEP